TLLGLLDRAAQKLQTRKDLEPRIEAELCWMVGASYRSAGEAKKGIEYLERAVQLCTTLLGRDHADTLNAMNNLGTTYSAAGQNDKALPLLKEALQLAKDKLGPDHLYTAGTMNNLATAYRT